MRERFEREYGLPEYDAQRADCIDASWPRTYEAAREAWSSDKKLAANWVMGDASAASERRWPWHIADAPVSAATPRG